MNFNSIRFCSHGAREISFYTGYARHRLRGWDRCVCLFLNRNLSVLAAWARKRKEEGEVARRRPRRNGYGRCKNKLLYNNKFSITYHNKKTQKTLHFCECSKKHPYAVNLSLFSSLVLVPTFQFKKSLLYYFLFGFFCWHNFLRYLPRLLFHLQFSSA